MTNNKPVFALQITNRNDFELQRTVKALDEAGCEWLNFGVIPFTDEITNLDAFPLDRTVIPLAGTKVVDMYRRKKLPPNWQVFYEQRLFDQCYTRLGGLHHYMLNRKSKIYNYESCRDVAWVDDLFVKPSNDLKVFPGMVLPAGQTLDQALAQLTHQPLSRGEQILWSHLRKIGAEYRLFIINDQVVAGSEYKRDGRVHHRVIDKQTTLDLDRFFQSVKYLTYRQSGHPPPLVYGVDVVEVSDNPTSKYEIVEFNCFHACGMYEADRAAVFSKLQIAICEEKQKLYEFTKRESNVDSRK